MPTGTMLPDGFAALLTCDAFPNVELFVKEPTPPGYNMGGPNPQSTMHNVKFRTQRPKKLITVTGAAMTVAFDPKVLDTLITGGGTGMLGKNALWHSQYADGSKHNFWGWLESFKPNALQEGQQPTAVCDIEVSNLNDAGVETGPSYTAPP